LTINDGKIIVPLHSPWSVRMTGKLGDRPATLQLTPLAVPKADTQTPPTKTPAPWRSRRRSPKAASTASCGRHRVTSRAMLSGKLNVGTVRLQDGAQAKASNPDTTVATAPAATRTKAAEAPTWTDKPLPFSSLSRLDADLALTVEALTWRRITLSGLQAQATLSGGRLQLDAVRAALPGLTVTGQAAVDASRKTPAIEAKLTTDRIDLAQARSMLAEGPTLSGSIIDLSLDAQASGTTPAALIRSLSGTLKAKSARLLPPAKRGRKATAIELATPTCASTRASRWASRPAWRGPVRTWT
jgi:hypothetical protein